MAFVKKLEEDDDTNAECGQAFVIYESNVFRRFWNIVLIVLFLYIGTLFPYRLCFVEFQIPEPVPADASWRAFQTVVDVLFWLDLGFNFFFTYPGRNNVEVDKLKRIVKHYLKGYFTLNLIACLPQSIIDLCLQSADAGSGLHRTARMTRLQRIARLARLLRLAKASHIVTLVSNTSVWRFVQGCRGAHIVNFVVGLLWVVHMMACGWYLCAALHSNYEDTWVARREVDPGGTPLVETGPLVQWCHAMYFVLTVFTTVGFGDISAVTYGEIFYVTLVMLIGAVVHSMVVSGMVATVTKIDSSQAELARRRDLIKAFAMHTELEKDQERELSEWSDSLGCSRHDYDRNSMRELLTANTVPHSIVAGLTKKVFHGRLLRNSFIAACQTQTNRLPPRLSLLMALMLNKCSYISGEFVYHKDEHPFNLYLVDAGTFAHVGKASVEGGSDAVPFETNSLPSNNKSRFSITSPTVSISSKSGSPSVRVDRAFAIAAAAFPGTQFSLYPYDLACFGDFFGMCEILEQRARRSTVRCESSEGSCLVLHKPDLFSIMQEFPSFVHAWRAVAAAREKRRFARLANLTKRTTYKSLAASRIQHFFRRRTLPECARRACGRDISLGGVYARGHSFDIVKGSSHVNIDVSKDMQDLRQEVQSIRRGVDELRGMLRDRCRPADELRQDYQLPGDLLRRSAGGAMTGSFCEAKPDPPFSSTSSTSSGFCEERPDTPAGEPPNHPFAVERPGAAVAVATSSDGHLDIHFQCWCKGETGHHRRASSDN